MADETDKKQSSMKKTPETESGDLSSDSEGSVLDARCDTCDTYFSDGKTYENHMKGKKHRKAVAKAKFLAKHGESNNEKEEESGSDDDSDDNSNNIYCEVCGIYVTGHVPYVTHVKGNTHAKNMKKQKLKERMKNMPEVLDKEDKENEDDDDLQKPFARCTMCQKEFSGPESFNMHLKSALHNKKVQQSKTVEKLKADNEDDCFDNCAVCHKAFSGPVPYQIHMKSKMHMRNLEKMKIAEEIKEFCSNDKNGTVYVCKVCKKTFTDPAAFKNHLTKNSHEKQKAKTALLDFLTSHPEIVFTTAFEDQNQGKNSDSDEEHYLICKICHLAFSGPESAQAHVKSKKHSDLKKDKNMRKLLKAKKEQAIDSSKLNGEEVKSPQNATETEKSDEMKDSANGVTIDSKNPQEADDFELI